MTGGHVEYQNNNEGSDWEKCLNVGTFQSPIDIKDKDVIEESQCIKTLDIEFIKSGIEAERQKMDENFVVRGEMGSIEINFNKNPFNYDIKQFHIHLKSEHKINSK